MNIHNSDNNQNNLWRCLPELLRTETRLFYIKLILKPNMFKLENQPDQASDTMITKALTIEGRIS